MKRLVLFLAVLAIALPLATAHTHSWQSYNTNYGMHYNAGSNYGWQTTSAWTPYRTQPSINYYDRYQRPQGYGLVQQRRSPYPPRGWAGTQYCDNTELIGHTSSWQPGVYRAGLDGRVMSQPRDRPRVRNCPSTRSIDRNHYRGPYW